MYRFKEDKLQLLLVHPANAKHNIFGIPKGHIEENEKPLDAAIRETLEETGIKATIIGKLDIIKYKSRIGKNEKTVHIYLAEYLSGIKDDIDSQDSHDNENDIVRFFDSDKLPAIYDNLKAVISNAIKFIMKEKND